jgi:hypothetical protein
MSERGRSGGIHVGNVGGNVLIHAGGDVVGGNKTTTARGFRTDNDRHRFQIEIETLRNLLREIKAHIEVSPDVADDDKDELAVEVLQHVKELKQVRDDAASLGAGQPPAVVVQHAESGLDRTTKLLDKLKTFAGKSTELAGQIGGLIAKLGPMVVSLRGLLGLA